MSKKFTLNQLIPLPDVLRIFGMKHHSSFIGSESWRPVNLYKLTAVRVNFGEGKPKSGQGRVLTAFEREEIYCLALLFDLWETGVRDRPDKHEDRYEAYRDMLRQADWDVVRDQLENVAKLAKGDIDLRLERYNEIIGELAEYPDIPFTSYLTKKDVMNRDSISYQTVYNRTARGKLDVIKWQGYNLWTP